MKIEEEAYRLHKVASLLGKIYDMGEVPYSNLRISGSFEGSPIVHAEVGTSLHGAIVSMLEMERDFLIRKINEELDSQ